MKAEVSEKLQIICDHCGDVCHDKPIIHADKHFCCEGCQTVYEILSEKDLCTYYDISEKAGISLKNRNYGERFAFLDNAEIAEQVLSFVDKDIAKVSFFIPTIHCSSCIWLLENLYKLREGVHYSRVNFVKKELSITFNPAVLSLRTLAELLATVGYAPEINTDTLQPKAVQAEQRTLFLKIGVAGFCLGNIMLFSFPDYLAMQGWANENYGVFFAFMSILISIPLVFYSGSAYFVSAYQSLKTGIINLDVPISLGIAVLWGRSLYEILTFTGAGYLDSLAGLIFFLLCGRWFQSKTYESMSYERDYKSYLPLAVTVEGGISKLIAQLVKGEKIYIKNQEIIPADSRLESEEAMIDYSFVTGESQLIRKQKGDYIFAGAKHEGSTIVLEVDKPTSQSYLTQLWNNQEFRKVTTDTTLQRISLLFSRYFTHLTLTIALLTALYWAWADPSKIWNAVTAVLIIACPCALSLATPFTFGNAMRILGRNHFYLKNADLIATLAEVNHLIFDKTGTLTSPQEATLEFVGTPLLPEEQNALQSLASHSTHPLSRRIARYNPDALREEVQQFQEQVGRGIQGVVKGKRYSLGNAIWVGAALPQEGAVGVAIDGVFRGYFMLQHQYRKGIESTMHTLRQSSYTLSLISGDHAQEHQNLKTLLGENATILFEQSPIDKLEYVKTQTDKPKQITMMVGDGLNDAGALQRSHVGVAVAEDTNTFTPACDAILAGSDFTQLPTFLQFAKKSIQAVQWGFWLSVVYNVIGLSFAISGNLSPLFAAIFMPLSSASVVIFAVVSTNLMAKKMKLL